MAAGSGAVRKPRGFAGEIYQIVPHSLREDLRGYPLTHELSVTDIGYYPRAFGHFYRRREGAREHILIVCESGAGFCGVGEREIRLAAGQFLIIPAGVPHEYGAREDDPWTIAWCHTVGTDADLFARRAPVSRAPFDISQRAAAEAAQLFSLAFDVVKRGFSVEHLTVASSLVRSVLAVLVFGNTAGSDRLGRPGNRHVEQAVEYISRNLDSAIGVGDIAAAAGISVSRLMQLFREHVGGPPKQYLTRERMLRACHYLDATDAPVSQIAELVGYPDPLHFSRAFRRVLGRSPRQYRNRRRA